MSYTKIPATNLAGTLGKAVGKSFGNISGLANKALDGVEDKIYKLQVEADTVEYEIQSIQAVDSSDAANAVCQQKASTFNNKASAQLAAFSATLATTSASISAILKAVTVLKTTAKLLKIPLPALKVLIPIIKMIPIPQRWLIVSFTVLESDLLELLEQLVKQAEDEIGGLEGVASMMEATLKPVLERIERIKAQIALLKVSCMMTGASDQDRDVLDQAGLLDKNSGETLMSKIQNGLSGGGSTVTYGLGDSLDLGKPELANQLFLANEGDTVSLEGELSGSYIETWFCSSSEQPSFPEGFPQNSGSWSKDPSNSGVVGDLTGDGSGDIKGLWKVDLNVTGKGVIFGGLDSEPEQATEDDLKAARDGNLDKGKEEYLVLGYDNYNQKPGILKIDDWSKLLENVLDKLRNLPLTQELKDSLTDVWNINVVSAKDGDSEPEVKITKFQYISKLGDIYNLEVIEDEHSPRVAVRRYVRVADAGGTVIMDGLKTFSVDVDSLIQEIKLQLDQLTQ